MKRWIAALPVLLLPLAAAGMELVLPPLDPARVEAMLVSRGPGPHSGPYPFAVPVPVSVDLAGILQRPPALAGARQDERGVLTVRAADAANLNLGFDRFRLPAGAWIEIHHGETGELLARYSADDNDAHGQLWTPVFAARALRVSWSVPDGQGDALQLRLARVGHGFRALDPRKALAKSGSCHMDVACLGDDDPLQQQRRAVARIVIGGSVACTASLLNNTAGDHRMLLVTATHCGIAAANAPSVVAYWNYESPVCRTPGSGASAAPPADADPARAQTGAVLLAATRSPFEAPTPPPGTASDFTLVELDDPPPAAAQVYWAGWNRGTVAPACSAGEPCAGIHHPWGHEKRITYSEQPLLTGSLGGDTLHWYVRWDPTPPLPPKLPAPVPTALPPGVTEPGSSGSPLYDGQRRLVGVLSGGDSYCGAQGTALSDLYGKLAHAWDGLGSPDARLRDWLDPQDSGVQVLDGLDGPFGRVFADGFEPAPARGKPAARR